MGHDTTPQDQAGVCDLSQEPVKAENVANEPGRWAERQSVFATHKWHGIRGWAPNSKECIRISTQASIREMMLPGVYAIFTPVFVGFLIGARMLMGVLAGSVGAGAMLAIMMATFYYCKYMYNAAEEEQQKAAVTSSTQPSSPKKQTWHQEAATNAQDQVEHGYFTAKAVPAASQV